MASRGQQKILSFLAFTATPKGKTLELLAVRAPVANPRLSTPTRCARPLKKYGLVQGRANAIAPGKRPLSSMSPTIVLRDGQVAMVLGTPGGSRIITTLLHTLVNVIDHGMTIQEAVEPRHASTSSGCPRRPTSSRSP